MRALLVGQAPQRSALSWQRAWDSASGKRLAEMMGTTHEQLMATFQTDNLNRRLVGTKGKYDLFDKNEAARRAASLKTHLNDWDLILCCGKKVVQIMGFPWLEFHHLGATTLCGMPHPGGTNHWWNDPANAELGRTYAKAVWETVQDIARLEQEYGELPRLHQGHRT